MSRPSDLVQGTLDLLILKMLALQPLNGWAIGQRLLQVSGDILQVSDGSLYPALHKLEQEGWIKGEWRASENNRRARFYSLTRAGHKHLHKEAANWERISSAITRVVALDDVAVAAPHRGRLHRPRACQRDDGLAFVRGERGRTVEVSKRHVRRMTQSSTVRQRSREARGSKEIFGPPLFHENKWNTNTTSDELLCIDPGESGQPTELMSWRRN